MIYLILIFIAGLIAPVLDIHSTMKAMENPNAWETNKRFRLLTGKADIPKLILWKIGYYAVAMVILGVFYYYAQDLTAILIFVLISSVIHLPAIFKNFKVAKPRPQA